MSQDNNIDENEIKRQQPQPIMIIHESQGPSPRLIIGLICLFVLFVLYFGFTASKQPWGYILGILPILFLILLALNDIFRYLVFINIAIGGFIFIPIIISLYIIALVYTR